MVVMAVVVMAVVVIPRPARVIAAPESATVEAAANRIERRITRRLKG